MKLIKTQVIPDNEKNYNAAGDAGAQPKDVDQCITSVAKKVSKGGYNIVANHRIYFEVVLFFF
jgi:hypothetical protein